MRHTTHITIAHNVMLSKRSYDQVKTSLEARIEQL